jgi:hypothetical protein
MLFLICLEELHSLEAPNSFVFQLQLIHDVLQCFLCNSSKWHYLEPLRKGVIAKMAYLAEFWIILESDLVENSRHKILDEMI